MAIPIRGKLGNKTGFVYLLVDILQATAAVIITGGYDSLFFVMYLLPLSESIVLFRWEFSAAAAVLIDSIQMAATSFHLFSQGKTISTYLLVNRFVRLMMVSLILIILSIYLRKTEEEKNREKQITDNLRKLNDIFNGIGQASLDLAKIYSVIISNEAIDKTLFCASILRRLDSESPYAVEQSTCETSAAGSLVTGLSLGTEKQIEVFDAAASKLENDMVNGKHYGSISVLLYKSGDSEESIHLLLQKKCEDRVTEDIYFFLNALALKTQMALGNALAYQHKRKQLESEEKFRTMQSTFFTAASHELKTPLTILSTLLSALSLTIADPTEVQSDILKMLENNVKRLNDLIADSINTAKLEADSVILHVRNVHMKDVVKNCVDELGFLFAEKKLTINILGSDIVVRADSKWIVEVVSNIVSNAYKFSRPQSVITITLYPSGGSGIVKICNEGDTIPGDVKEKIFDKFYTSSGKTNKNGFGLGLYIAKRIVALHHGEIWVDDKDELRNCICFSIPLAS